MKTVIFDLDGTLVDSRKDICASINHVRETLYALPPLDPGTVAEKMNRPGLDLAREFYGAERYEARARECFEAHYARQCLVSSRAYPGVRRMLGRLRSADCDLFVATNAPTDTSRAILRNNHLDGFFADIIGADRVRRPKPDPEMLLRAMAISRYGEAWMAGDSPKDMMAAEKAGAEGIFVTWGYTRSPDPDLPAKARARKPEEIADIILDVIESK